MPRARALDRLDEIADAALAVFSERGFKNTQVSDIAKQAGISSGTIYLYVEGKEALFYAALLRSLGQEVAGVNLAQAVNEEALLETIRPSAEYYAALEGGAPLEDVLSRLWDNLTRVGPAVRLIERCAWDWPALAARFFDDSRPTFFARFRDYLREAAQAERVRPLAHPEISARFVIETIAWFTMHRLGDHDGKYLDAADAKRDVLDHLVRSFAISIKEID